MDPLMPKAIWGFNGTERPGAVYLASALAGHNQKGLPAFGIYGSEVQDMDMAGTIPDDVRRKLLLFGKAVGTAQSAVSGKGEGKIPPRKSKQCYNKPVLPVPGRGIGT